MHRQVLALALPMVLSNITVPLLGLVDAAVIGHLDHAWYLGGVALGSTMISVAFWLLGFLRMSTTGLTAQALGRDNNTQLAVVLLQGLMMAWLFAAGFLLLQQPLSDLIFSVSSASDEVKQYAAEYFDVRIWSAPAALANYVLLGWLLGMQNGKAPMWMVIVTNLTNILLDLLFVVGLGWKVEGAALASVIADYTGMMTGLLFVLRSWRIQRIAPLHLLFSKQQKRWLDGLGRFVSLNKDIFLRSLCLQAAFSFMTFRGAGYGDDIVAANAVLMSFLMIISYGMDGFAYSIEAMVGKAIGAQDRKQLQQAVIGSFFWSLLICFGLSFVFALFGRQLVGLITDIAQVRQTAADYLVWLVAMPLVSMWCFLLDGIFIGATKGREMRNSMFIATLSFFAVYFLMQGWGNHALWAGMTAFMAMRGIGLGYLLQRQWRAGQFL
jgi:MATE family multidrug resistance protein